MTTIRIKTPYHPLNGRVMRAIDRSAHFEDRWRVEGHGWLLQPDSAQNLWAVATQRLWSPRCPPDEAACLSGLVTAIAQALPDVAHTAEFPALDWRREVRKRERRRRAEREALRRKQQIYAQMRADAPPRPTIPPSVMAAGERGAAVIALAAERGGGMIYLAAVSASDFRLQLASLALRGRHQLWVRPHHDLDDKKFLAVSPLTARSRARSDQDAVLAAGDCLARHGERMRVVDRNILPADLATLVWREIRNTQNINRRHRQFSCDWSWLALTALPPEPVSNVVPLRSPHGQNP